MLLTPFHHRQPTGPELRGSKRPPKFVATPFDFVESLHSAEMDPLAKSEQGKHHRFEVTLEPSSFSEEKFELYRLYQSNIHKDPDNTPSGFKRFLVTSPLAKEQIAYPQASSNSTSDASASTSRRLPPKYGSYHQMYRLDGQLIAMGVLDILPSCVSSVYFMYDPAWEKYSLGKVCFGPSRDESAYLAEFDMGISFSDS
jgi:arginine-tRNA-protein transferase